MFCARATPGWLQQSLARAHAHLLRRPLRRRSTSASTISSSSTGMCSRVAAPRSRRRRRQPLRPQRRAAVGAAVRRSEEGRRGGRGRQGGRGGNRLRQSRREDLLYKRTLDQVKHYVRMLCFTARRARQTLGAPPPPSFSLVPPCGIHSRLLLLRLLRLGVITTPEDAANAPHQKSFGDGCLALSGAHGGSILILCGLDQVFALLLRLPLDLT